MAENPFYQYVSDTGIIVPDMSDILLQVQDEWQSAFGRSISVNPSTPQGRIIEMSATGRRGVLDLCALVANQINLDYSTGQFLDGLGALFTVSRRGATSSLARCTVTGIPGTVIPAGSRVSNNQGDIFVSETAVTIGSSGNTTLFFRSEVKGAIPVDVGTITKINSPVAGWESVSNNIISDITLGSNTESDADFRNRIKNSRYSGISLMQSITAALYDLEDIKSFVLYENYTNTEKTIVNEDGSDSNVVLSPHSICLIVSGGDQQQIAAALFRTKSGGCGYTAIENQSITVNTPYTDANGRVSNYPVTFNSALTVPLKLQIKVYRNTYVGDDLPGNIKNAVTRWGNNLVSGVDGIRIGHSVSPFEVGAGISAVIPEILIQEIQIGTLDGELGFTPVMISAGSIATISDSDIAVFIDGSEVVEPEPEV